jgi:hypothetical protein
MDILDLKRGAGSRLMGLLPKSLLVSSGVAALLRSAGLLRKTNTPRFTEARLQRETRFGQQALLIIHQSRVRLLTELTGFLVARCLPGQQVQNDE